MTSITVEFYDKLILGQGVEYTTNCNATGLNNNVLVIGGSGSGKTMSIVEPRMLEAYGSSLVVTVSKRRLVDMYTPILQKRGYKVMILDFTDPTNSTVGYDPLSFVREEEDVAHLAEALVMSNPEKRYSKTDPYWIDAAVCLMSALILYVLETSKHPSFNSVLALLANLEVVNDGDLTVTSLDEHFNALAKKNRDSYAVRNWATFRELPIRTSLCVFSELNSSVTRTFTQRVRQLMIMPEVIDFTRIGTERSVLFVIGSPVNNALYQFINLLYSQMIKELFSYAEQQKNGEGLPVPVTFIFDDFASGSKIHGFSEIISTSRAARMSFILLLQSESQLEYMYGSAAAQNIEDNCDSMVFLGCNNLETAQKIGLRIDQPPQEVLSMPLGWEWIFRRGEEPICIERYDTPDDPRYIAVRRAFERNTAEEKSRTSRKRDAQEAAQDKTWLASVKASLQKTPARREKPKLTATSPENTSPRQKASLDSTPEKTTSPLEDLIEATKALAISYEASGRLNELKTQLCELADLYYQYYGETNEAQVQVLKIACKLVDIGAYYSSLDMLDRLYSLSVRSGVETEAITVRALATISIAAEKAGERRKARSSLAKLETYKNIMPALVSKTIEVCREIREKK